MLECKPWVELTIGPHSHIAACHAHLVGSAGFPAQSFPEPPVAWSYTFSELHRFARLANKRHLVLGSSRASPIIIDLSCIGQARLAGLGRTLMVFES